MLCYAKSLQSFPTLCDPIDGSPPGSPVPGILQARTLEWVEYHLIFPLTPWFPSFPLVSSLPGYMDKWSLVARSFSGQRRCRLRKHMLMRPSESTGSQETYQKMLWYTPLMFDPIEGKLAPRRVGPCAWDNFPFLYWKVIRKIITD